MIVLEAPESDWPGDLLNTNMLRGQSRFFGRLSAPWRAFGTDLARTAGAAAVAAPVRVWVEFRFPTNHRRDTANLYPTSKALLDGIVDAGVLPDDCDGLVEGPFSRRVFPNGPRCLRVVIEPMLPEDLGRPIGRSE